MLCLVVNVDNLEQIDKGGQENGGGNATRRTSHNHHNTATNEMLLYPAGVSTCPKRYSDIMGRVSPSIRGTSIVARIMNIENRVSYSS